MVITRCSLSSCQLIWWSGICFSVPFLGFWGKSWVAHFMGFMSGELFLAQVLPSAISLLWNIVHDSAIEDLMAIPISALYSHNLTLESQGDLACQLLFLMISWKCTVASMISVDETVVLVCYLYRKWNGFMINYTAKCFVCLQTFVISSHNES